MNADKHAELQRRVAIYHAMEKQPQWPGALTKVDVIVATVLTLGLIFFSLLWGY